jgi:streptogramin lyase
LPGWEPDWAPCSRKYQKLNLFRDDNYLPLGEVNFEQVVNSPDKWWLGFGPDGKLWAWRPYNENGFVIASKSENEAWNIRDFSSTISGSASVDAITFDKQGFPWIAVNDIGNQGHQFIHCNGKSWEIENIPSPSGSSIRDFLFDQQGRLWVAFSDTTTGLAVRENGIWTFFSTSQVTERGTDGVHALYLDDTGLLWFGTGGSLVSFNTLRPLPAAKPLPDDLVNTRQEIPVASVISGIAALIMVLLTLKWKFMA